MFIWQCNPKPTDPKTNLDITLQRSFIYKQSSNLRSPQTSLVTQFKAFIYGSSLVIVSYRNRFLLYYSLAMSHDFFHFSFISQARVSINCPELTELGLRFLCSESEQTLYAYPEADMLLSARKSKPYSSFAEWGRGWADPEIRRQRLQGRKCRRRKRKRKPRKMRQDTSTVRGRLSAKLSKKR